MYYINYEAETGEILGVYPSTVDFDDVPSPKIAITDEQYNNLGDGYYIVQSGQLVQSTPPDYSDLPEDPTEEEQIVTLQSEYLERLSRLKRAYTAASIMEEADLMEQIQRDYRLLLEDFTGRAKIIEEAGIGRPIIADYCVMCGTPTVDGVCPNCHWRQ